MTALRRALDQRFPAYTAFAAAGLPIYIYAPKYYADTFGVSLSVLGAMLFALRLFDVVQDPVLGWIAERLRRARAGAVTLAAVLLAASMVGLFAVTPPIDPLWWFALMITGLFSAFSFLTVNFYAQGIAKVGSDDAGHVRLAAWRESGALGGICLAAIAPTFLMGLMDAPFAGFAWGFAAATMVAALFMWREWVPAVVQQPPTAIRTILADRLARRLLLLALVNATPLAVSSTLFLFYVDSRLGAAGWEGPLLVLFFLSAAVSSPFWSLLSQRFGAKRVLLAAMCLAVAAFGWTLMLGTGDVGAFAIICVLSGATIGADLTLLPAMFAKRMAVVAPNGGQGFGLWSLVSKFTLAFAAALLLPLLESTGFSSGTDNPQAALNMLTGLYALVPSVLKLVAIGLLALTPLED
mgnify:CR=1 FL=1